MRPANHLTLIAAAAVVALGAGCGGGSGEVQFGAVLPLTGEDSGYGLALERGIDLAIEEFGREVSELPYVVTLRTEDSGSDPEQAARVLAEVYSGGAIAAIGGVTSREALAMVPVADDAGRVLLSPTASSPRLNRISGNFFRIFPSSETEAVSMARHALDNLETGQVAILQATNPFGEGLAQTFTESFTSSDGVIPATVTFEPGDLDLSDEVAQLLELEQANAAGAREERPNFAVYIAAAGEDLANAIRSLRGSEYESRILASSALASPQVLDSAGQDANFVYFTQPAFDPGSEDERISSFVAAYEAKYGEPPDLYAAHGYDAVKVLLAALGEARSLLPSDFRTGMRALSNLPAVTGAIQFNESGTVQRFMRVHLISEGGVRDYEDYMTKRREEIQQRREELERQRRELERRLDQGQG